MARYRITESTLKKLFAFSGNECAFPDCAQRVVNAHGDLIGEVCHIEAASETGQRYNPDQSDEERRHFDNLLVLCPTHHTTTDNVAKDPVDRLQQMKEEHESRFASCPFELSKTKASRLYEQAGRIAASKLRQRKPPNSSSAKATTAVTKNWPTPGESSSIARRRLTKTPPSGLPRRGDDGPLQAPARTP